MRLSRTAVTALAAVLAGAATISVGFLVPENSAEIAVDTDLSRRIRSDFDAGKLDGLHGVYAELAGDPIAEVYFRGTDEAWGRPLGERLLQAGDLHDIRSVTKSIVGLLYGIALADGKVPAVETPLVGLFPDYPDLAADPERAKIRVWHALSMTMGTEWSEELPYTDPANSEIAMEMAADRYRFVLDRPMVEEPGTRWIYNGGATAVIAKLIADGTGMAIDDYAKQALFGPLGIDAFEWVRGQDGTASAASGLRLRLRDLAKIGRMVTAGGLHQGKQIVPEAWLKRSFVSRAAPDAGLGYGYFWWLDGNPEGARWMAGFGNGGQRLHVQPDVGLVVTVLAGNYNAPDAWQVPVHLITNLIIPDVRKRLGKD